MSIVQETLALIEEFVAAAKHTAAALGELKLPLATEKSFTLASSYSLAAKVARFLNDGKATQAVRCEGEATFRAGPRHERQTPSHL